MFRLLALVEVLSLALFIGHLLPEGLHPRLCLPLRLLALLRLSQLAHADQNLDS